MWDGWAFASALGVMSLRLTGAFQGRHGRTKVFLVLGWVLCAWAGCRLLVLGSLQVLHTQLGASQHPSLGPNPEAATSPMEDPPHGPASFASWVAETARSRLYVPRRSQADPVSLTQLSSFPP